jgi:hypothetical protein
MTACIYYAALHIRTCVAISTTSRLLTRAATHGRSSPASTKDAGLSSRDRQDKSARRVVRRQATLRTELPDRDFSLFGFCLV